MEVYFDHRYLGVLASLIGWAAIMVVLLFWPSQKSKSISKHVSASKQTWLLFAPIETVSLVLLYIFSVRWLMPTLDLPIMFQVVIGTALVLELITTWVPDTTGIKHRIHHYTSYSAAVLLPVVTLYIASSALTPALAKIVAYLSTIIAVIIIGLFVFMKDSTREKYLIWQSVYFACFHLSFLSVIFTV